MTATTFAFGSGELVVAGDGEIAAVRASPGAASVLRGGRLRIRRGPAEQVFVPDQVLVDADEVELAGVVAGLPVVLRHSLAAGRWNLRLVVSNPEPVVAHLDRVHLSWRPEPGRPGWALAAGRSSAYAVVAPAGAPLLGAAVTSGSVRGIDASGWELGPLDLAPQSRYVTTWSVDWYPTARSFGAGHPPGVPTALVAFADETLTITAGPDEALVVSAEVQVERLDDRVELTGVSAPQTSFVDISSAAGTTAYELYWSAALAEVLADPAEEALTGRRSSSGVVRLPGTPTALVVQHLLTAGGGGDPVDAEDALELWTARLRESGSLGTLDAAFLVGEFSRTGDEELLDLATETALRFAEPVAGLGLLGAQLVANRLVAGRSVGPLVDHLVALAALRPGTEEISLQAAWLELNLVTRSRRDPAGDASIRASLIRLGPWLGAGLPGRLVEPLPLDVHAHLAVVLDLTPETVGASLRDQWGVTAAEVARRGLADVGRRLPGARQEGRPIDSAYGWLVLHERAV